MIPVISLAISIALGMEMSITYSVGWSIGWFATGISDNYCTDINAPQMIRYNPRLILLDPSPQLYVSAGVFWDRG